jgi:hypothetical protein
MDKSANLINRTEKKRSENHLYSKMGYIFKHTFGIRVFLEQKIWCMSSMFSAYSSIEISSYNQFICGSFNNSVKSSEYIASMINESENIWKEAVMASFMLSCHLPREAADTTESFRISGPRAYI